MSKFLNILNKYNSLLAEADEQGLENIQPNGDAGTIGAGNAGADGLEMTPEVENELGDTNEATPKIGDQDLIDLSKILLQFINDEKYDNSNKDKLIEILRGARDPEKVETVIPDFVSAWKQNPAQTISKDSTE
jgi:hypothetical protein